MKVVFCDSKDEIPGFDQLNFHKKKLDYSGLSLNSQFRVLRDFKPISLSWRDNVYLPYVSDINKVEEGFDRLDLLWREVCPHSNQCPVFWSPTRSSGNLFPRIMIVGLNPGLGDYLQTGNWGTFWTGNGRSTVTLRNALIRLNIHNQCWITNLVRCATGSNAEPDQLLSEKCYHEWLSKEIDILKPEIVIALGRAASSNLSNFYAAVWPAKHPAYYVRKGKANEYYRELERLVS